MANVKISELNNAALPLAGTEEVPVVQSGTTRKTPVSSLTTYPAAGIPVSTGTAWGTSKTNPAGDLVGTTATQTLTNKTLQAPNITSALTLNGAAGTSGQVMVSQGAGNLPAWAAAPGGANLQEFSSSGTWTKPAGATFVMAELWAAGGGGGSGRRGTASGGIYGGGGGGGGAYGFRLFKASDLAASVSVNIGSGGTGGAAITVDSTNGNAGTAGGNTSFGTFLTVYGGAAGGGGQTTTAGGGNGGGVLDASGAPTSDSGSGHFGRGTSSGRPSGFGGGNGGSSQESGGSSYQGGPAGGGGGSYTGNNTSLSGSGGGISGSSGSGALGGFVYAGANGVAGSGREGGSGGASGYSLNSNSNWVAFGNSTFALTNNDGNILTSSNGTNNWVFAQTPSNLQAHWILHDGTQFVLMNNNGTRCHTTTNFSTFTQRTAPGVSVGNFRFANGRYFVMGGNQLLQSTDLVTWSSVATGFSGVADICWSGTNYVATSASSPYVRYSADLATWTTSTGLGTSSAFYCTSNGSGTVVVTQAGTGGPNAIRSTNHGASFANVSTALPSASGKLSFAGSTYFYFGSQEIHTSTDGASWTSRMSGTFSVDGYVAFDGTTFVVANSTNGSTPAYTAVPASLGTWTARSTTARDVAGGTGGAGGTFGGGGGGGGGSNNGQNSGAGGNGGAGYARIYSW